MTFRAGLLAGVSATLLVVGVAAGVWWLVTAPRQGAPSDKPPSAASVTKVVQEGDLNIITLTEDAEKRLASDGKAVAVAEVDLKLMPRKRLYGGEVTVKIGHAVLVVAPMNGTLQAPDGKPVTIGQRVSKGQAIFRLAPIIMPESRPTLAAAKVDAETLVNNAQTSVNASKIALTRAQQVESGGAGTKRAVDEAQALYDLAVKALEGAQSRYATLARLLGEVEKGAASPFDIDSPRNGLIRNLNAQPDQLVPSGAPLFELLDLDRVWVRVAVPVGDEHELAQADFVEIGGLTGRFGEQIRPGRTVDVPPTADIKAGTVDRYFEIENPAGLIPGQRVGVRLPLRSDLERWYMPTPMNLIVPKSALILDIHGGTWVYERLAAPRSYVRRRVTVSHIDGEFAVLHSGPPKGTSVVIAGAQELFGVETGYSK